MKNSFKAFIFLLLITSCESNKKYIQENSIKYIYLKDYYLYKVDLKNKNEDYYCLIISKKKYVNYSINKMIKNNFLLVDRVSFKVYFDAEYKNNKYTFNDFADCERKKDYHQKYISSFENDDMTVDVFKISGKFQIRRIYSEMYNAYSTRYINIKGATKIWVITLDCAQ